MKVWPLSQLNRIWGKIGCRRLSNDCSHSNSALLILPTVLRSENLTHHGKKCNVWTKRFWRTLWTLVVYARYLLLLKFAKRLTLKLMVTGQIGQHNFVFGSHQLTLCWWCNKTTLRFGHCGDCIEWTFSFWLRMHGSLIWAEPALRSGMAQAHQFLDWLTKATGKA